MTLTNAVQIVQTLLENDPDATESLVTVYLQDAQSAILRRLYPFGIPSDAQYVPDIYGMLWCKLAMRYFLRRGAEGEYIHDENGTNRHYASVNDEDLLMEITPFAKIVGG